MLDEVRSFVNLNNNNNLTQRDYNKIDFKSPSEHQNQNQETQQ